jgi:hypothetical protein
MFAPAEDEDVALSRPILAPCAASFDPAQAFPRPRTPTAAVEDRPRERRKSKVRAWRFEIGTTTRSSCTPSDILALEGDDLRKLLLHLRKTNLARLLARKALLSFRGDRGHRAPVPFSYSRINVWEIGDDGCLIAQTFALRGARKSPILRSTSDDGPPKYWKDWAKNASPQELVS